jgi:hypothetical protein
LKFQNINIVGNALQFVNYTEIMSSQKSPACKEAAFAMAALMEIPKQYLAIKYLQSAKYIAIFSLPLICGYVYGIEDIFLTWHSCSYPNTCGAVQYWNAPVSLCRSFSTK